MARKWTSVYAHAHATSAIGRGAGDSSRDPALPSIACVGAALPLGMGHETIQIMIVHDMPHA